MDFAFTYISMFSISIYLAAPLLIFLVLIIVFLGWIVSRVEKWKFFHSLYWAFITATTVGYGDVKPTKNISKFLSVVIAIIGIMFTGMILAISIEVATKAFTKHANPKKIEEIRMLLEEPFDD